MSESPTVADLGEFGLIERLTERLAPGPAIRLGPGDDAAVVAAPGGSVLASTDMLVEGRHFRLDWSTPYDIGRRAAAANLADIAAMAGTPTALLVGIGVPAGAPAELVLRLADGMRDECEPVGAGVAGGDIVAAERVVLGVTALGSPPAAGPVTRSGARPGDRLAVCGRLGLSGAGCELLRRGLAVRAGAAIEELVEAYRRPAPPYSAGPEAAELGATAMLDVSDGLVADVEHIALASGVTVDLDSAAFEPPDSLVEVAGLLGTTPLDLMLTGGEDHALVATFPADVRLPARWRVCGIVTGSIRVHVESAQRAAVGTVRTASHVTVDGAEFAGPAGHVHF